MLDWFRNLFARDEVDNHYRSGLSKAQHKDFDDAIADYTAVVCSPSVSSELCAMALYNRAVAHRFKKSYPAALADLEELLAIQDVPLHIRKAAIEKRGQLERVLGSR